MNLAVLLGTGFLVVHGAWRVISGRPGPGWLGRLALGLGLALVVISGRFSARLLRVLLLLSVAVVLLGLVNLGRDATEQRRLREARATATALATRVDLATPSGGTPRPDAANSAVAELCRAAGGGLVSAKPRACEEATDPQVSLATLNDRRTNAELEVARYRLSVAGTDTKKTLAAEVEAKEAAYAEAVGKRNEGVPGVGVAEAVQAGAGAVLAALPWIGQDQRDVPVALEVVGWALLGAAALLLLRWLEQRAARRALGPVEVEGKEETDVERFRTYVLRNVPDPGAVPGSSALQPVTDLLAATQVPTIIGKVLSAIAAALTQKKGYVVRFRVFAQEPAAGGAGTEIAVRVSKARNGELVEQEVVDDATKDRALRKAAYWAAAVVLDRSDRVPRWAQWSSETSESLAVFFSEPDRRRRELSQLEEAVRRAPTSGVLCLQLSNAYALKSRHLDAFELALRPATLYPNFVAACYRLAMAASLVASDVGRNWWSRPPAQRARVLFALERFVASADSKRRSRGELDSVWAGLRQALRDRGGRAPSAAQRVLCQLALLELDHIEQLLRVHWILANALRRSERSYWIALLRPGRDQVTLRTQFRRAAASAEPAVKERGYPGTTSAYAQPWQGDRKDWRNDPRTFWQVAYNLACWQGIRHREGGDTAEAEAAIGWLETAVERPNSHQLTRSWVTTDPDLQSLRGDTRFQQLKDNLPSDGRADGGDA